jgi:hypothetical protein
MRATASFRDQWQAGVLLVSTSTHLEFSGVSVTSSVGTILITARGYVAGNEATAQVGTFQVFIT